MNGLKLAHVVNPVEVSEDRELYWQQPITYKTMTHAKHFAESEYKVKVELWATVYPEDSDAVPSNFKRAKDLTRSIQDIKQFPMRRKLPLFKDILDNLYESTDADYMIQTNVDIGLMPHFYATVAKFISQGYDSFIINKRIIPHYYRTIEQIPDMWCELGTDHNGYDCFVFRRELYPQFYMGDNCMGIPWSETSLTANMVAFSKNCQVFKHPHLSFHIGDSRTWASQEDYRRFNTEAFAKVLTYLANSGHNIMHNEIISWLLKKMIWEVRQAKTPYPQVCEDVISQLTYIY